MIPVLVGEEDAIQFVRLNSAEREAQHQLARAQTSIDQEPAMIGRDQGRIPGTAASEHGQAKHVRYLASRAAAHKQKANEFVAKSEEFRHSHRNWIRFWR